VVFADGDVAPWALGRYRDTSSSGQHGGGDDGFTGSDERRCLAVPFAASRFHSPCCLIASVVLAPYCRFGICSRKK
jgi:hypothetical protein